MSLLPENYEKPVSQSGYYKFTQGENRFRMISPAITGWIDRDKSGEKPKPIRTHEQQPAIDPSKQPKHFWAMRVFDYESNTVKILDITQATIQNEIYVLTKDDDRGPVDGYDIVVTRTGEKLETTYTVMPKPKKELTKEQLKVIEDTYINLDALFDGDDPFEKVTTKPAVEKPDTSDDDLPF